MWYPASHVTRHTSHVTHHTSHITYHTSHIRHHTSHITHQTSHILLPTPTFHSSGIASSTSARILSLFLAMSSSSYVVTCATFLLWIPRDVLKAAKRQEPTKQSSEEASAHEAKQRRGKVPTKKRRVRGGGDSHQTGGMSLIQKCGCE